MVGARRRRIVAVIGGDHQQIVAAQARQQRRQARVEALEVRGVARRRRCDARRRVSKSRGWRRSDRRSRRRPSPTRSRPCRASSLVVWTAAVMPRPANRSSILPIATTGSARRPSADRAASRANGVSAKSWRFAVRLNAPGRSDERPRDDPADAQADRRRARRRSRRCDTAREPGRRLRARRSERRCRPTCRRSACRSRMCSGPSSSMIAVPRRDHVAERRAADAPLELGDQVCGEAVREDGKGPLEHEPHQLPVAGDGILAGRRSAMRP